MKEIEVELKSGEKVKHKIPNTYNMMDLIDFLSRKYDDKWLTWSVTNAT